MLGANPRPAAAIFGALTGSAQQKAALQSVAASELSDDEADVFAALLQIHGSIAKERADIAHHIWGHCDGLQDAVLLAEPRAWLLYMVTQKEWRPMSGGPFPGMPRDKIFVYRAKDFEAMSERIQRLIGCLEMMRRVVRRLPKDDEELVRLKSVPEVQESLFRLLERRTRQSARQQPPQTPETGER